jgi:hypothetical protein
MITQEQLESIGFRSKDGHEYYDVGTWDMMYDIKTQTLYSHCEVDGVGEKHGRITDIQMLKDAYESMYGSLDE